MTDLSESAILSPDPFEQAYLQMQRRYWSGLGMVAAAAVALVACFAWITSLPILQDGALLAAVLPIPFLFAGMLWYRQDALVPRRLMQSLICTMLAWILVGLAAFSEGLSLGYERELHELEPVAYSVAGVDDADPEQAAIWAAIERAKSNPTPISFRVLVPYLDRVQTDLVMPDGSLRNTAAVVREVLWSDKQLLFRAMDAEARAMAALLPADAVIPRQVTIPVAKRLEFALKTLITAHSEQKIQTSFDVPSVGINIKVEAEPAGTEADTAADVSTGAAVVDAAASVSNREIGITYPYAKAMPGDVVFVNAATVDDLLVTVRADLGY